MIEITKFKPIKDAPDTGQERQLMMLRLSCPTSDQPMQMQYWHDSAWQPIALDDTFATAFESICEIEVAPEGAEQLHIPDGGAILFLVPGNWVWSGLETLPKAARRQSRAVAYMVEERLAEEVEDLHFICRPRKGDLCSVYGISLDKMKALHSQLQKLGWPVAAVLPEYGLLELVDGDVVLWLDNDRAHIWYKAGYGLSVRRSCLHPLLASLADEAGENTDNSPRALLLGAGEADRMLVAELESLFGDRLEHIDEPAEDVLPAHYKPGRLVNLMSGDYELADRTEERDWWRRPLKVASACFVAQLLLFVAAGTYYQWQANTSEQQARALFTALFPQDRPSVDIRRQVEGYLKRAEGGGGKFAGQMQLLGRVWERYSGQDLRLQSLRFDGNRGEMVLQLQAPNLTDLDTLVSRLSEGEFRADLLGANELEKGVSGRIRLR